MKTVARLIFASSLALKAVGVRAELPPSIEEALFGLTEGNVAYGRNYREWLKSDGTVVFAKNFGFFDKGVFRAFTDNSKDIHFLYNIEMRQALGATRKLDDIVSEIRGMEKVLLEELMSERRFSVTNTANSYSSACEDIDSHGWNVWFSAQQDTNGIVVATANFNNALHRKGEWVSCEDLYNGATGNCASENLQAVPCSERPCPHADRPRSSRLRSAFKVVIGVGMFLFVFAAFACGGFNVVPKAGKKEASWT